MKLIKETLYEKFSEDSDPIDDMNIGKLNQIKKDLKDAGISEEIVKITDDLEIYYRSTKYHTYSFKLDKIREIQLKYLPDKKRKFAKNILDIQLSISKTPTQPVKGPYILFEDYIKDALDDGISPDDIEKLVKEFGNEEQIERIKILLTKLTRTEEKIKEESENNIYIFIGYTGKVPVIINGKQYYEDKLEAESLIKIDKYNPADLSGVNAMRIRLRIQNYPNGAIYMVTIPKFMMNKDKYNEIPEEYYDLIDKYKVKI